MTNMISSKPINQPSRNISRMPDTVKMARPHFPRRKNGVSGRVERDDKGNAVWVRTRATDEPEIHDTVELSLVDESPRDSNFPSRATTRKINPGKTRR